jgi:hypothetical protein
LVEALCCKLEGQEAQFQIESLDFSFDLFLTVHYGPRVNSACNRNKQECFRGKRAASSMADNLSDISKPTIDLAPPVNQLSRTCRSLNISEPHGPPQPVTR